MWAIFFASVIPFILWVIQKINNKTSRRANYIRRRVFAYCLIYVFLAEILAIVTERQDGIPIPIMGTIFVIYGFLKKDLKGNRGYFYSIWESYKPEYVVFKGDDFKPKANNQKSSIDDIQSIGKEIINKSKTIIQEKASDLGSELIDTASKIKNISKPSIICPNCGALNEKGDNFCGECGTPLPDFNEQIEEKKPIKIEKKIESKIKTISNPEITSIGKKEVKEEVKKEVKEEVKEEAKEIKATPKVSSTKDQLKEYKQLFDEGLISEEEYTALKKKALNL